MSNLQSEPSQQRPWYKEPWLWLVILLPASSVVAGIATVIIAHVGADDLVVDDYYKVGMAINQNIEAEQKARDMGLKGRLFFSGEKIQLQLQVDEDQVFTSPSKLMLEFFHPTMEEKDLRIELKSLSSDLYSANLTNSGIVGRRYLRVTPNNNLWNLKQDITIEIGKPIFINARQ